MGEIKPKENTRLVFYAVLTRCCCDFVVVKNNQRRVFCKNCKKYTYCDWEFIEGISHAGE